MALVSIAGYLVVTSPMFFPRQVFVTGNRFVARSEIIEKASFAPNRNVWLQNIRAVKSRIASIPYIDTVEIHRRPNASVSIVVTERAPFAVVAAAGNLALVDRDLRVLATGGRDALLPTLSLRADLAFVPGAFLKDAALQRLRDDDLALVAGHVSARALTTDAFGQLVASLPGGVRLLLGDDEDLTKKIPLIVPILSQLSRVGRPVSVLDLRAPATPVVVYKRPH